MPINSEGQLTLLAVLMIFVHFAAIYYAYSNNGGFLLEETDRVSGLVWVIWVESIHSLAVEISAFLICVIACIILWLFW